MEITVTRQYDYRLGPAEQVCVEVLNDRYGRINARRWHSARNYAIELATISPDAKRVDKLAWHWLAAAVISLLGLIGFIAYTLQSTAPISIPTTAGGVAILLVVALVFLVLFRLQSSRRIVFYARFSGVPLVEIPLPLRGIQKGVAFTEALSKLAQSNRDRLQHTDQELRAGELRMLRRLSEEGAIPTSDYDQAKLLLLRLSA